MPVLASKNRVICTEYFRLPSEGCICFILGCKTTELARNCLMIVMTFQHLLKTALRTSACLMLVTALNIQAEDKPTTDVKPDTKAVSTPDTSQIPIKPVPSDEELKKILS